MFVGFRRGLSPLLAILIGLVVVVIASVLVAQLYFNYAGIISLRPAAMIEYVDVVDSGSSAIFVINIKNTGNVPITGIRIVGDELNIEKAGLNIPPGRVYGFAETIENPLKGRAIIVTLLFDGGSTQTYTITFGPLGPRISEGDGEGGEPGEEEPGDFGLSLSPGVIALPDGRVASSTLTITSVNYEGRLRIMITSCPWPNSCSASPDEVLLKKNEISNVQVEVNVPSGAAAGEYSIGIKVEDVNTGYSKGVELTIRVQYFALDVLQDRVSGIVGGWASATIELRSLSGYSGCIDLGYEANPPNGIFDAEFNPGRVCLGADEVKTATFNFKINRVEETTVMITGYDAGKGISRSDVFAVEGADFHAYFSPESITIRVREQSSSNLIIESNNYAGTIGFEIDDCSRELTCVISPSLVQLPKDGQASAQLIVSAGDVSGEFTVTVRAMDQEAGHHKTATLRVEVLGDFELSLEPEILVLRPGADGKSLLTVTSIDYEGTLMFEVECPWPDSCSLSETKAYLERNAKYEITAVVKAPEDVDPGKYSAIFKVWDAETGYGKRVELTIYIRCFELDVVKELVGGKVGDQLKVEVVLKSMGEYSGCIDLSYEADPPDGISDAEFDLKHVCLNPDDERMVIFSFRINRAVDTIVTVTGKDGVMGILRSDTFRVVGMDFDVYFSPSSITILVGREGSSSLMVVSRNYEGIIEFRIVECPSPLTCTISPTSVQLPRNGQASARLTVRAGDVGGVFTVKVEARDRNADYSKIAFLTVRVSDFSITLNPSSITIRRGSSGTVSVTINSIQGYSGTITLRAINPPARTIFTFTPNPVTIQPDGSAASILTIVVGRRASTGTYNVVIRGTDQNGIYREVVLQLTIT